ncbi:uncharacterized protein LOC134833228 [Culicoides brevitarsis]|uniref:uncharacterized protein LOC134833228 n=1 Tax=Culicoides brevitarsis TaxID=469753 RepID=UPI00307C1A49
MSSPKENGSKRKTKGENSSQETSRGQEENEERRLSSRVKKPKLVYDPSDKHAPYRKINLEDITKSPSKHRPGDTENAASTRKSSQKAFCAFCSERADMEPSTTCISCNDTYHNLCHDPKIGKGVRRANWHCYKCRQRELEIKLERKSATSSRAPSRSASSTNEKDLQSEEDNDFTGFNDTDLDDQPKKAKTQVKEEGPKITENLQINVEKAKKLFKTPQNNAPNSDTIPDVSAWTYNQIHDYFAKVFPKEAFIFKDQEIDGTSLLLMTRSDMFKFNLKLGPALNIYRHIVMLQTRSYDPRKTWM